MRKFGIVRRYDAQYFIPGAAGGAPDWILASHIIECAKANAAANGLRSQLAEDNGANTTDLPSPALGDAAGMRQLANVAANGAIYQALLVAFTSGRLVAFFYVYERGQAAAPASGVAISGVFQERIRRVRDEGGPGLGAMTLRVTADAAVNVWEDNYFLRDGQLFRWSEDSDAFFAGQQKLLAGALDAYRFYANFGEDPDLQLQVVRLPDQEAAAKLVKTIQPTTVDGSAPSWKVDRVAVGSAFGDESSVLRFHDDTSGSDRYLLAVGVDALVATAVIRNRARSPAIGCWRRRRRRSTARGKARVRRRVVDRGGRRTALAPRDGQASNPARPHIRRHRPTSAGTSGPRPHLRAVLALTAPASASAAPAPSSPGGRPGRQRAQAWHPLPLRRSPG